MMKRLANNDIRVIVGKFNIPTMFFTLIRLNCNVRFLLLKATTFTEQMHFVHNLHFPVEMETSALCYRPL